jgi:hypothetical protein
MIDPNNIVISTGSTTRERQLVLGIVVTDKNGSTFYFAQSAMGNTISSIYSAKEKHSTDYLYNFYADSIDMKDVLVRAGAIMTTEEECDINLAPEKLEKDTIINLIKS